MQSRCINCSTCPLMKLTARIGGQLLTINFFTTGGERRRLYFFICHALIYTRFAFS